MIDFTTAELGIIHTALREVKAIQVSADALAPLKSIITKIDTYMATQQVAQAAEGAPETAGEG